VSIENDGSNPYIGYLDEPESVDYAINTLETGGVVGVSNTAVFACVSSLSSVEAGQRLFNTKDRRLTRTVGALVTSEQLSDFTDMDRCSPDVRKLLEDPEVINNTVADLAFVRFPIKHSVVAKMSDVALRMMLSHKPEGDRGMPYMQGFVSEANTEFKQLEKAMHHKKLPNPVITSMNISGQPEITEPEDAKAFCKERDIPLLLNRNGRNPVSHGSFPIFEATPHGLICVRVGNISTAVMRRILQPILSYDLDQTSINKSHVQALTPSHVPELWQQNLQGKHARDAIINQRLTFESAYRAA